MKWMIIFLSCLSLTALQAERDYIFRLMSPEDGLSYDGIKETLQDGDGRLWVMMDNNLLRFDGYRYTSYYASFTSHNPTRKWLFSGMTADSAGRFFVSANNGLYVYCPAADAFECMLDTAINMVRTDARNNIWVCLDNGLWHRFDADRKTLTAPLNDGKSVSNINPLLFCTDGDDMYVFSNNGQIYRFDYARNEFRQCLSIPCNQTYMAGATARDGKLWVFMRNCGLYAIDLSAYTIDAHFDIPSQNASVRKLYADRTGNIWIGAIDGLYVFDPRTQKCVHYTHSDSELFGLPNNSIWTVNADRQQNLWIGAYSGALCYVNLDERFPFTTCFPEAGRLNHAPVSAFAEDGRYLWIGTEGKGINRMDRQTGQFSFLTHSDGGNSLSSNNIKSLVIDSAKNLWIATYSGGLNCYTAGGKFIRYMRQAGGNSLLSNNIRKIVLEKDSGLWIAYQNRKPVISFFSFDTKTFTHCELTKARKDYYIFDMLRDSGNRLWILGNDALYSMDAQSGAVEETVGSDSIFMNFRAFGMDDSNRLWIGTEGNGLARYEPDKKLFSFIDNLSGCDVSFIFGVCCDSEGGVWLGTAGGLARYHAATNRFFLYDKKDGVQGAVFCHLATMKGMNGDIYMGGTKGFTVVRPSEIKQNAYRPKVIISDFYIDHQPVKGYGSEIELNYRQTNIGFGFSCDNYLIPEKNRFRYRLLGYDSKWIETDAANRTVQYSKIPSGRYVLEVEAANNDGLWSGAVKSVRIVRQPAPWHSLPAYALYGLILLAVVYMVMRYYREKRELVMQKEIQQAQMRFFTNISHDFKTPLSLILASLDKLRMEGMKEFYYRLLSRNARRLLNLVNEIMDLRTVDNGKMKLELQETDINAFVAELAVDFRDYAEQRNIAFKTVCDTELPSSLYVDRNAVEKVIMNLLNNAFRFTSDGGIITLETIADCAMFHSPHENSHRIASDAMPEKCFAIAVRDSGAGISKQATGKVFDRFFKTDADSGDCCTTAPAEKSTRPWPKVQHIVGRRDNTSLDEDMNVPLRAQHRREACSGTGIGLSIVKSLVLLHNGAVCLHSEENKGTDIAVCLPVINSRYNSHMMPDATCAKPVSKTASPDYAIEDNPASPTLLNDKKTILVVEDNDDLRSLAASIFLPEHNLIQACDGDEAIDILDKQPVDMVISDIMMPRKDGITLTHEIKNSLETSHIPVVLLTAKTGVESKIEGADAGADAYLEKPVDFNLLKITVRNIFNRQRRLREYYAKNYYADSAELASNEHDNKFLKDFAKLVDDNMSNVEMDVGFIAARLSMSYSKLYQKIKSLTGKSPVEFITSQRMRKAARLLIENNKPVRHIMDDIGIESPSYFTTAFKKEFGETPKAFAGKHRKDGEKIY